MPEMTISERADALAARAKAAGGPYRRRVRVPATMQEVVEAAEIMRDLAELIEQRGNS